MVVLRLSCPHEEAARLQSESFVMSHVPHDLASEFPDQVELIHSLKARDQRFARLVETYHEINREVHRIETRVEAASEERESQLRRERMRLKDEIAAALAEGCEGATR